MIDNTVAVILAAGGRKKMKSAFPRVMTKILSRPMLEWVMSAAEKSGVADVCVVTGADDVPVHNYVGDRAEVVIQQQRLGTAHAVMQAKTYIKNHPGSDVLILNGDAPLMDASTIRVALENHRNAQNAVTIISAIVDTPFGYGRIVRDEKTLEFKQIVEERDASSEIKKINEISSGTYWFKSDILLEAIENIKPRQNENYNLVDAISYITDKGLKADVCFALCPEVVLGANTRSEVSEINEIVRKKVIDSLLDMGVDIPCIDGIIIDPSVEIGMDTTILPNTVLRGNTKIGKNCVIGPNSFIEDSKIGDESALDNTKCRQAIVGMGANIGPFVQIRPNTVIKDRVHLGNFVEVKNSTIDDGTKVSHLTYVGDSDVGKNVNFGCGTVTVNYNGKAKFRTKIGNNAFIGCNTNLIAPVTVGDGAYTAAGSTITENVPGEALGIARARQVNKEGWVVKYKKIEK